MTSQYVYAHAARSLAMFGLVLLSATGCATKGDIRNQLRTALTFTEGTDYLREVGAPRNGHQAVNLQPLEDWFCYVSKVSGDMNGGGEAVTLSTADGFWVGTVTAGSAAANGVQAEFRCHKLDG